MKSMLILGKRGSGKTFLMSYKLRNNVEHSLSIDTLGDMQKLHRPIILHINTLPNVRQMIAHYSLPMPEWVRHNGQMPKEIFFSVCDLLLDYGKSGYFQYPFVLAVDEIQTYCDRYDMPKPFADIVNIGRHYNLYYYVNSRRYPEIHKDIVGNTEEIYAGASLDVNDVNRLCEIFGKDNTMRFVQRNIEHGFLYRDGYDKVSIVRIENDTLVRYEL